MAGMQQCEQSSYGLPDTFCVTLEPVALAPAKGAVTDARSNRRLATIGAKRQNQREHGEAPEVSDPQLAELRPAGWLKTQLARAISNSSR
jgi:hypothetical protein